MISLLNSRNYMYEPHKKVSRDEYEVFDRNWIFEALKGLRYGQAFCNKFEIQDGTPLFYFNDIDTCKRWIEENYLEE